LVVLKATTRTGLLYWPSEQIGDHGLKIGIVNVGLAPGEAYVGPK